MEQNSPTYKPHYERLVQIIDLVRDPAGETFDQKKINENHEDFIKAFHDGYKKLHYSLIHDIMIIEGEREKFIKKRHIYPRNRNLEIMIKVADETISIWRRANDCIAWMMLGMDRNKIRRLCFRNPRGKLIDQNPDCVLEVLDKLNSPLINLAIWTDATSCIDVGDILFCDKKNSRVACIELKEGITNLEIEQIIESGCERALYFFLGKYGKKGKKQFERTIRQCRKYSQALNFIESDTGYDHKSGEKLTLIEVKTPDEYYHKELDELLDNARKKGFSTSLIDKCLWLFAYDKTKFSHTNMIREFSKRVLSQDAGQLKKWLLEFSPVQDSSRLYPIYHLSNQLKTPEALPIYLFQISSLNVLDILLNNLIVLMFIDWNELKKIFEEKEIDLTWSSKKEGKREKTKPIFKRALIIGERIPILKMREIESRMGPGAILKICYEGIRPKCIVDQRHEAYELMIQRTRVKIH